MARKAGTVPKGTPAVVLERVRELAAAVDTLIAADSEVRRLIVELKGPGPGTGNYGPQDGEPLIRASFESYALAYAVEAAVVEVEAEIGDGESVADLETLPRTVADLLVMTEAAVAREAA